MIGSGISRLTAAICLAAGLTSALVFAALGNWRVGLALGVGLAGGAVNSWLAGKAVEARIAFGVTSLVRIGVLSIAAMGVGLVIDPAVAWLTVLGVAASQLVMAGVAAALVLRR